jgi:hypothetical protein
MLFPLNSSLQTNSVEDVGISVEGKTIPVEGVSIPVERILQEDGLYGCASAGGFLWYSEVSG